jgi:hypothetical protein
LNAEQLLADLAQKQILIYMDGDRLRYRAPQGALSAEMRAAIGAHRAAIVEHLREKCVVCDRQNWVDEPAKQGKIRTVCGKCGRFVGYRPAGANAP